MLLVSPIAAGWFLVAECLMECLPSPPDRRVALASLPFLLVAGWLAWLFWG